MKGIRWLLLAIAAIATAAAFWAPDAKDFANPKLARIIFFHLPSAILSSIYLIAGAILSARYLKTRQWQWEVRAVAANEMGTLLAVFTMITGVLFSKVQWGAWWQWDPRQTSFLLVLLLFLGYFALRAAHPDETQRASFSAAYAVAMLVPTVFLIFVAPRIMASFHPNSVIVTGGFMPEYRLVLYGVGLALLCVTFWIYRLRVRVGLAEKAMETYYDRLDDRRRAAAGGVARPVPISDQGGVAPGND